MSKRKDNNERYATGIDSSLYNTENLSDYFEYVGQDKDGTTLVRRKPDNTPAIQKAANVGAAVIFKLFGL